MQPLRRRHPAPRAFPGDDPGSGPLRSHAVNIDTDLRLAMTAEIRRHFVENPCDFDPRKYLGPARDAIQRMVRHKIKDVLNASGQM